MGMESFYNQLSMAEAYLKKGEEEKARQILFSNIQKLPLNAHLCFRWAKVCEELGLARYAIKLYRYALRAEPKNPQLLFNYALLLNDIGYYEDAIHYLKKSIRSDPENRKAKKLLAELLSQLGLKGQAELLTETPAKKEPLRYFPPTISKEHIDRILELFSGREVGYAVQQLDSFTAEPFYRFLNLPLSPEVVERHINGEITIAVYPIRSNNTAKYAALKVKIKDRILKQNIKNTAYLSYLEDKACNYCLSVMYMLPKAGISAYLDYSGDFSFRIWFFFKEFVHFLKIKRFLKNLLEQMPPNETYLAVEQLIGTKGVGIGWQEHPILLPFGINLVTKKRIMFLDNEGNPYPDQLAFLKKIQQISFKESLYGLKIYKQTEQAKPSFVIPAPVKETIKEMIKSCTVLKEIVKKASSGRVLSNQEKLIIFYTVGILDIEGTSLHRILYFCPDYNYTKVERQRIRLKQNPISCIKIRELLPELTSSVSCNCVFDLRGGRYPSPVMHINPALVPPRDEFELSAKAPISDIAKKYVSLKRQKQEIDLALKKASKYLEKYYHETGKDSLFVNGVRLVRKQIDQKITWEIER